jgi:hypothetical protein
MIYENDNEKGYVLRTIAEERLESAWMKCMTTQTGLSKARTAEAAAAAEALHKAMQEISKAKNLLWGMKEEDCVGFWNEKGGYRPAEEIAADYRKRRKSCLVSPSPIPSRRDAL